MNWCSIMRIQASLEFLVLASVVALLALSVISYYLPIYRSESRIEGIAFAINASANSQAQRPLLRAYPKVELFLNNVSYFGKIGYLQMLVEDCNGYAVLNASSSKLVFLSNLSNLSVDGLGIISLPYFPTAIGLANVRAGYSLHCGNETYSNSTNLSTYVLSTTNSSTPIYARLDSAKEDISYPLANPLPIIYTTQSTRCTLTNFFYQPLPLQDQCGTPDVWGYEQFSIWCYYNVGGTTTTTTCIYPHNTTYATSNITGALPIYSFLLHIYTPFGVLNSSLNTTASAPVYLGLREVGTAHVENVTFFPNTSILESGVVWRNATGFLAKPAAFKAYVDAQRSMYSTLAYYNSTLTYSPNIYQAISDYEDAAKSLLNSSVNASCSVVANSVVCGASMPFEYLINVHLHGINLNTSLQYLGSEINIMGSV